MKILAFCFWLCVLSSNVISAQDSIEFTVERRSEPRTEDVVLAIELPACLQQTITICPSPTAAHASLLKPLPYQQVDSIITSTVPLSKMGEHKTETIEQMLNKRIITINNAITTQMATYTKHWSGNYTPEWKLLIDGQIIEENKPSEIIITDNKLSVEFAFDFFVLGKSYQKGSSCATFEIPFQIAAVDIEFTWDQPERLLVVNKTPSVSIETKPVLLTYNEKK